MSHAAFSKSESTPATRTGDVPARADAEPSIGQLVAQASRDVSSLVKSEIALAKSEVKISVKAGGVGAALFAVAGFIALLAVVMLSFGIVYLINLTGLDLVWCFLIVFLLYLLLAGLVAFLGLRSIKKVRAPQRAIHQAQETKETLLHRGH
jgi:ABC-type multidrug transport system fused ATPase/permease subunit